MHTSLAPTSAPVEPPAAAPVAPETPPSAPERRRPRWPVALALLLALVATVWLVFSQRAATPAAGSDPTVMTVGAGHFVHSLRVSGTVEAVESFMVSAPRLAGSGPGQLIVTYLAKSGTQARKGDLLAEFDPQVQLRNELDRQTEFRNLEEQVRKKESEQAIELAKDQSEMSQAENAVRRAEAEVRRNEVVSKIDAEKNQQTLEESRARVQQLKETFELKRKAARAELRSLEIQRDAARRSMEYAQRNAERMVVRSPIEGVIVLSSVWKSGQFAEVQVGDEVRPAMPFLQVVNNNAMQVRAKVNQADIGLLQVGQRAKIRLDAYPEMVFDGVLETVSPVAVPSNFVERVRTFVAVFSIKGSDPKLLPDLSAAVDVEIESVPNAIRVPLDAILYRDRQPHVMVRRNGAFEAQPVKLASSSHFEAVVQEGLKAGDVVKRTVADWKQQP